MFGPTVSPQLVQSGKGRIASDPALLNLPRPSIGWGLFDSVDAARDAKCEVAHIWPLSLKAALAHALRSPLILRHHRALVAGAAPASRKQSQVQTSRELMAPILSDHLARLRHRRANTSPHDNRQPRTLPESVPHSNRRRSGAGRNEQSDWRSIEGSRRHRTRMGGCHDRSA
jgi:hypothetical protein